MLCSPPAVLLCVAVCMQHEAAVSFADGSAISLDDIHLLEAYNTKLQAVGRL